MNRITLTLVILFSTIGAFAQVAAITGPSGVCAGSSISLSDATLGGTWTSSLPGIGTIDAVSGSFTGIAAGVTTVTYTSGTYVTTTITVNPLPLPISGPSTVCTGATITVTNGIPGGSWTSSNALVGTINSSGVISGIMPGVTNIAYILPATGCATILPVTVNPTPSAITGVTSFCTGYNSTLMNSVPGGTWSSSSPGVAIIGSATGIATGIGPGMVTIYYSFGGGCTSSAVVTVNALPAPIYGATSLCLGISSLLSDGIVGGTWTSSNTATAIVGSSTGLVTGVAAGTCYITYTLGTGCATSKNITINPLPNVYTLTGGGAYCPGAGGVHIGLSYCQSGVNYQLYNGTTPVGASEPGSGSALDFGVFTSTGAYTVSAANPGTGCTRNWGTVTISTNPLPAAYNVLGGGAYCTGGTGVPVSLTSSQPGITYELLRGTTTVSAPMAGTGIALSFGMQTVPGIYTIVATNTVTSCTNAMNGTANVSVNSLPLAYTVSSSASAMCAGGPGFHVNLSGTSTGSFYQLMLGGISTGAPLTGTGGSLDFGLFTSGGTYSVIATDAMTGCTNTMTGSPTVIINPLPAVDTVTGGGAYCSGGSGLHLYLNTSIAGINYQLYTGGTAFGGPVSGTGSTLDFGLITLSGTYTVIATNPVTNCTQSMAGSRTVTINPLPTAYTVGSTGSSYCAGGTGISVTLSSSDLGCSYQLYVGSTAQGIPLTGTGAALNFGLQTIAGTYTVKATNNTTGCSKPMNGSITISILAAPSLFTVTGGGSYCAGSIGVPVGLTNSQFGFSYQLFKDGTPVYSPITGAGTALDFGHCTAAGTYTIVATNTTTGCISNMYGSAAIGINPLPLSFTVTGGGGYCAGGAGVHIGLNASETGVSYLMYNGTMPVGSPMPGAGSALDFGLQTVAGIYSIKATSIITGCQNTMASTATIGISALPVVFSVTGGGNYCSGGAGVHIGLNNSSTGTAYYLYNGGILVDSLYGTGLPIDFGLHTPSGTYTVVATNPITGCTSNMSGSATVSITPSIIPSVTLNINPNDTICTAIPVTYTAVPVNEGSSPTYTWHVNGVAVGAGIAYTYLPLNGDVISLTLNSSAACAFPSTVSANVTMVVRPNPGITGDTSTCVGTNIHLTGMAGGVWTSANSSIASVATIGSTIGVLSGVTSGITNISYSLLGCTSVITVTVYAVPVVTASAMTDACGGTYTLTASGADTYSWLPTTGLSCNACDVTNARPLATTIYTVTGTATTGCKNRATVITDGNRVSGYISYLGTSSDIFKVWLIRFNPTDSTLTGLDSTLSCMISGTPYFEFKDKPAGNYMVKTKLMGTIPGSTGYIPTYSLSTPYWYSAANNIHGNATDTFHINMLYGTVPPGPGFIGGYISSGAGKGTSGDIPAAGMLVFLRDPLSYNILTYTYTDASGHYSFGNIAEGNYDVYPEELFYTTTPCQVVMLGNGTDSTRNVNFKEYVNSRKIRPVTADGLAALGAADGSVNIFPNPTSGKLNIKWDGAEQGMANLCVADVVGRIIYTASIDFGNAAGLRQIDLGNLKNGIYMLNIKSDHVLYNGKLLIER